MSDAPSEFDQNHPSQAEGEDPSAPESETQIVLEQEGKPSAAEGEDPDDTDVHEVLDPVQPD
jgi:hypothetical protein